MYYEYIQNSEKRPLYPGTVQFSTESEAAIDGGGTKRANETVTKRLLNRNCQWERTCEPNGTMAGDPVGRHLRAQRVTHHTLPRGRRYELRPNRRHARLSVRTNLRADLSLLPAQESDADGPRIWSLPFLPQTANTAPRFRLKHPACEALWSLPCLKPLVSFREISR